MRLGFHLQLIFPTCFVLLQGICQCLHICNSLAFLVLELNGLVWYLISPKTDSLLQYRCLTSLDSQIRKHWTWWSWVWESVFIIYSLGDSCICQSLRTTSVFYNKVEKLILLEDWKKPSKGTSMFSLQLLGYNDNNFACNSVRLIQVGSQRRGPVKIKGKHFSELIWPSCDSQITMKGLVFFWVMFSYWLVLCWKPQWCRL